MGISDREYLRTDNRSFGGGGGGFGWDIIGRLIAVTVVVYVLQLLIDPGFTRLFELRTSAVLRGPADTREESLASLVSDLRFAAGLLRH